MTHVLKQHTHRLLLHTHPNKTHYVRVLQICHQVNLTPEVILYFGCSVLLQSFDGNSGNAVVAMVPHQLSLVDLSKCTFTELLQEADVCHGELPCPDGHLVGHGSHLQLLSGAPNGLVLTIVLLRSPTHAHNGQQQSQGNGHCNGRHQDEQDPRHLLFLRAPCKSRFHRFRIKSYFHSQNLFL